METGQKTIQTSNSLKLHTSNKLSIQISLSGLSFCVLNSQSNTIEHIQQIAFEKKLNPNELLERLKTVFDTNTTYAEHFDSVVLIYQNELSSLVPKPLFKEENSADYLKFNAKILNTDYISFDEIEINNSINVYVPLININNYIFDKYGEFEYKHASTIYIDAILKRELNAEDTKLYINVEKNHLELVGVDKGTLVFYNAFEYHSIEDFIYYILFTIEQLHLDQESIVVVLTGIINKDDELYNMLYKYVRHVDFLKPDIKYKQSSNIEPYSDHDHFILLNSY